MSRTAGKMSKIGQTNFKNSRRNTSKLAGKTPKKCRRNVKNIRKKRQKLGQYGRINKNLHF